MVDYLIIGQGIAGTLPARALMERGCSIAVIDDRAPHVSSRVAGGLINPVTGKRVVKTWLADQLLSTAVEVYRRAEEELGVTILHQTNILDFFDSPEHRDIFLGRAEEEPEHLQMTDETLWKSYFNFNYGVGEIRPGYYVDMQAFTDAQRTLLLDSGVLSEEVFDWGQCTVTPRDVRYKHIAAKAIIDCTGGRGVVNPYFSRLPYSLNKGEVIIARIPGLPRHNVYKQGLKIMPWKEDLFWIGSSFAWKYENLSPTEDFKKRVVTHLDNRLKLPYEIVAHYAAERPSTVDHKPFIGRHPQYHNICIFNGMGTKGCSLAPYFAEEFAAHLTDGAPLTPDVDVARFTRILGGVKKVKG